MDCKKIKYLFVVVLSACLLSTSLASAAVIQYVADLRESRWEVSQSKLQCKLQHSIPRYGVASFFHSAGKDLSFQLAIFHPSERMEVAYLDSVPPEWNHRNPQQPISSPDRTGTHLPFTLGRIKTLRLLYELERGMRPTFTQTDSAEGNEPVLASLSAVNFLDSYRQFQSCITRLLPFGFDDINAMVVRFDTDKKDISPGEQKKLDRVVEYSLVDRKVKKIVVHGHADWVGEDEYNQTLSQTRSTEVVNYLLSKGLPKELITFKSFGEKQPLKSNRTSKGRQLNRRARIQIIREGDDKLETELNPELSEQH